jgi:hypothetical protein
MTSAICVSIHLFDLRFHSEAGAGACQRLDFQLVDICLCMESDPMNGARQQTSDRGCNRRGSVPPLMIGYSGVLVTGPMTGTTLWKVHCRIDLIV